MQAEASNKGTSFKRLQEENAPEKAPALATPELVEIANETKKKSGRRVEDIISEKAKELGPIYQRTGEKKPRKNTKRKGGSVRKSKDKRKSRRRGSVANSMISSNMIEVEGFIKHRVEDGAGN